MNTQGTSTSIDDPTDYMILKWNGCNASTQIGTLWVTVSASI